MPAIFTPYSVPTDWYIYRRGDTLRVELGGDYYAEFGQKARVVAGWYVACKVVTIRRWGKQIGRAEAVALVPDFDAKVAQGLETLNAELAEKTREQNEFSAELSRAYQEMVARKKK